MDSPKRSFFEKIRQAVGKPVSKKVRLIR